jgi:hypothetical protein
MQEHEFSAEHNALFRALARNLLIVGVLITVGGIATIVQSLLGGFRLWVLIHGIVYCVMGVVFILPADNVRRIATTEGNDIKELMTAFSELDKGWLVGVIVAAISRIGMLVQLIEAILRRR